VTREIQEWALDFVAAARGASEAMEAFARSLQAALTPVAESARWVEGYGPGGIAAVHPMLLTFEWRVGNRPGWVVGDDELVEGGRTWWRRVLVAMVRPVAEGRHLRDPWSM